MIFFDLDDKINTSEVIKWGVFAGVLEGLFIVAATILYAKQGDILALAGGWELSASLFLVVLLAIGAIITTIIVFAHPIYCLIRRHYRDALLTVIVTVATITAITAFTLWSAPLFQ